MLHGSATKCFESKFREALRGTSSGGRLPELESWLCNFLGDSGIIMKTSEPQCLQLQNKGNKVNTTSCNSGKCLQRRHSYSQEAYKKTLDIINH